MSNRSDGNNFEQQLCQMLFDKGFWVHNMAQNVSGQPADIIAVRHNQAYLIDAKVCRAGTFHLWRIEPNQESSMNLWEERVCTAGLFALKMPNGDVYMIPYPELKYETKSRLTESDIRSNFMRFDEWIECINEN